MLHAKHLSGTAMAEQQCILHWEAIPDTAAVFPFTECTYSKAMYFCALWRETSSSRDIEIAARLESMLPPNPAEDLSQPGFHNGCYVRFTDATRLSRVKLRAEQAAARFPSDCIFCRRMYKTRNMCKSRRRGMEPLRRCTTHLVINKTRAKASELNDRELQAHIEGRDLCAEHAKYHESCYVKYVNGYRSSAVPEAEWPAMEEGAFKNFMAEQVVPQVLAGRACVAMNEFGNLFNETIRSSIHYKSDLPKFQLRQYCPFLRFVKPPESGSFQELPSAVAVTEDENGHDLTTGDDGHDLTTGDDGHDLSADDDGHGLSAEEDGHATLADANGSVTTDKFQNQHKGSEEPKLADIYHFAQHVNRGIIRASEDHQMSPSELQNFFAYCITGDTSSEDAFSQLSRDIQEKVKRMVRDLASLEAGSQSSITVPEDTNQNGGHVRSKSGAGRRKGRPVKVVA